MSYADDGKCHNAEPGTFGHECGKPAEWIGSTPNAGGYFRAGYCDECRRQGYEAKMCTVWVAVAT